MAEQLRLVIRGQEGTALLTEEALVSRGDLKQCVFDEIEAFNAFFKSLDNNSDLVGPERAILDTYLWWKTHQT